MSAFKTVSFSRPAPGDFYLTLRKKVEDYFKENNISRYANTNMKVKTIVMIAIYLLPYLLILTNTYYNAFVYLLLWLIMGVGMAGIGLSVMHDANHGSYSKKKNVNKYLGEIINLIGGFSTNWKIQHNVLHHTYTNVEGVDEDIETAFFMRFSPHKKILFIHRFQFIYAWFFYGLMTLSWVTVKDYKQLFRYEKMGLIKGQGSTLKREIIHLSIFRFFYFIYTIVLPLLLTDIAWYYSIIGFIIMHYSAGLILAAIFQPAHVMESSEYPIPENEGSLENTWAMTQLLNTSNFAPKSRLFSWYAGGLNFQIEHHLFPNICHIHYKKISEIVKEVSNDFGLPYYVQPTFVHALWYHTKMLKQLGKPTIQ